MKKLFALLLTLALALSIGAHASEAPQLKKDLVILFTSDVHCGVDQNWGYAGLWQVRQALEAAGNYTLLVDNGDSVQGEPLGTMTTGEANIRLMNDMGYDVVTIGNHEFDYGMDRFFELVKMARFPYVCCNFNKMGERMFAPYIIKEFDGVKIAFVGVTTPQTLTSSTPKYFQNEQGEFVYGFLQDTTGEKLYAAVQEAVDGARKEGADYVVVLAHLGNEAQCAPWTYADVIANTSGFDALLDGHSHDRDRADVKNKEGKTVLRQGCGAKMEGIGYLTIKKDGKLDIGVHLWNSKVPAPKLLGIANPMSEAVEAATAELNKKLAEVVAKTAVPLTIHDPVVTDEKGKNVRIIRSAETNLGDLCADAYRAMSGADAAMVNGGGIRVTVPAGDITLGDILKVHPFGNSLTVLEVKGQQILDALEWSVHAMPGEFGGFLQVSNLSFEIHTYLPSPCTTDENTMFKSIEGERRVKNVMLGGEAIDPEKTYTLASTDYTILNGGDGYSMFAGCPVLQRSVMLDNQVLINYITKDLEGLIGDNYANPYGAGRIVAVEEKP